MAHRRNCSAGNRVPGSAVKIQGLYIQQFRYRRSPFPERSLPLADLIERLPDDDKRWWPEAKAADVLARVREHHLPTLEGLMTRDEWSWLPAFWRTHNDRKCCTPRMDGLAGCMLATGGFARQFLLQLGRGRFMVRWITPYEAARLMGAGDFNITVSDIQALKGFGDAVCVPVVQWVSENYLTPLLANVQANPMAASSRAAVTRLA